MMGLREALRINLKKFRKEKALSQARLAEICDLSNGHIAEIETGNRFPGPETLEKIASALEVDASLLLLNPEVLKEFQAYQTSKNLGESIADRVSKDVLNYISRNFEKKN